MPGKLRWDDPPCGREGFDGHAGSNCEHGPHPNDVTYSIPDEPWNKLKPGSLWQWDNGAVNVQWVVTSFGLEPLYSNKPERYEFYKISADSLLQMHNRGGVYMWPVDVAAQPWVEFDAFEEAFKKALEKHGLVADTEILDRSFRRARGMRRRAARKQPVVTTIGPWRKPLRPAGRTTY
jgi:hypothetical protein